MMALYLTDETSKDTVAAAAATPFTLAFKLYPAGATTNSAFGISAIEEMFPIFEAMQEQNVILSIHGEVTDQDVDIFDREAVFIDRILSRIAATFPSLRIILEHITTREAVEFVQDASAKVAATITAHHLLYNRNDMLAGGMKPVHYCLPVLKRNVHQAALISAATSGDSSFFIGTDSAPHPRHAKENACGCAAGCYTAHAALELYTEVFEAEGQLDRLEAFTSEFGADFYQVPHNEDTIELIRQDWQVASALTFGNDELVPTRGGDVVRWQVRTGIGPL
jgi:dihydroorotase